MPLRCKGAILSASPTASAELLAEVQRSRPDLHWQLLGHPAQAVFRLCSGEYAVAVVGADEVAEDLALMLRPVRRCAPDTRLVVHARSPRQTSLRSLALRRWLTCVRTDALSQALAKPAPLTSLAPVAPDFP